MSGTKVTTDPESQNKPIKEGAGIITSDSLAAESLKSGGAFASTTGAAASGVSSKSTTTNTTDTSSAVVLDSATSASARSDENQLSEAAELDAGRRTNDHTAASGRRGGNTPSNSASEALSGLQKPKGDNLKENEGFVGHEPNASFGNTDVGGRKDPARVALADMLKSGARAGADAGGSGPRQTEISGDGQYDALKDASA